MAKRPYSKDGHGGYKYVKAYRERRKQFLVQEAGGRCIRCGYDRCMRALNFHHRDPTQKSFSISHKIKNLSDVREEVEKCDLLCANCHAEVHTELQECNSKVEFSSDTRTVEGSNPSTPIQDCVSG